MHARLSNLWDLLWVGITSWQQSTISLGPGTGLNHQPVTTLPETFSTWHQAILYQVPLAGSAPVAQVGGSAGHRWVLTLIAPAIFKAHSPPSPFPETWVPPQVRVPFRGDPGMVPASVWELGGPFLHRAHLHSLPRAQPSWIEPSRVPWSPAMQLMSFVT